MVSAKESLLAFMASSGKSQRQVAREIGISSAQINQFLADKYEGDSDSTSDKILQYLAVAEKRLNTDKTVVFYPELHNTREALFTCSYAHRNNEIALLCGDAGAGKTEALTYYRDNNPGVILVTANACIQSATAILQLICVELGKQPPYRRNAIMNLLVAQLAGTNRLIIVDEADHLSLQAIQALRSLNDQAHVGVVLSGNNKIYLQMYSPRRGYEFDQIRTRIVVRKKVVNDYTAKEIHGVFPDLGDTETGYLLKLANRESLRTAIKIYRIASDAAQEAKIPLNITLLKQSLLEFLGIQI